jgi:excisionase family DNA binding protein
MATPQVLPTSACLVDRPWWFLDLFRPLSVALAHLAIMDAENSPRTDTAGGGTGPGWDPLEQVLSMSELASRLGVSVQSVYDLRSQGRGPRGFRIGRELRFRLSEIDAWLRRLEEADAQRHPTAGGRR